jgi:hypothetical protein
VAEVVLDSAEEEQENGWGVSDLAVGQSSDETSALKRPDTRASDRTRTRLLLVLGGLLHITAVGLVIAWALGAFSSAPQEEPTGPTPKQEEPAKVPKKVRPLPAD